MAFNKGSNANSNFKEMYMHTPMAYAPGQPLTTLSLFYAPSPQEKSFDHLF